MRSELFVAGFAGTCRQRSLALYDAKVALCHTNGTLLFCNASFSTTAAVAWQTVGPPRTSKFKLEARSLKDTSPSHQHPFLAGGATRRFQSEGARAQ